MMWARVLWCPPQTEKPFDEDCQKASLGRNGRGGEIRTPDPLVPNQMRYQAALRPDLNHFSVLWPGSPNLLFRTACHSA
jgi:hypothetical protein